MKIFTFALFLFTCLIIPAIGYSQNLSNYTDQAAIVAEWLLRSTSHQPLMSATPINAREDLVLRDNIQDSSEFSISSMKASTSQEVKTAYNYFALGIQAPTELNMTRLQFTKHMGPKMDFSLSYLSVPDISLEGQGAHFSYNFVRTNNFYTTIRAQYNWVKKDNFFKSQSLGLELLQSWNTTFIDLYAGIKYYYGQTFFYPNGIGGPIPKLRYYTPADQLEKLLGLSKKISQSFRFDGQIKMTKKEKAFLGKISFTLPEFSNKDGQWRLPTIN